MSKKQTPEAFAIGYIADATNEQAVSFGNIVAALIKQKVGKSAPVAPKPVKAPKAPKTPAATSSSVTLAAA